MAPLRSRLMHTLQRVVHGPHESSDSTVPIEGAILDAAKEPPEACQPLTDTSLSTNSHEIGSPQAISSEEKVASASPSSLVSPAGKNVKYGEKPPRTSSR